MPLPRDNRDPRIMSHKRVRQAKCSELGIDLGISQRVIPIGVIAALQYLLMRMVIRAHKQRCCTASEAPGPSPLLCLPLIPKPTVAGLGPCRIGVVLIGLEEPVGVAIPDQGLQKHSAASFEIRYVPGARRMRIVPKSLRTRPTTLPTSIRIEVHPVGTGGPWIIPNVIIHDPILIKPRNRSRVAIIRRSVVSRAIIRREWPPIPLIQYRRQRRLTKHQRALEA